MESRSNNVPQGKSTVVVSGVAVVATAGSGGGGSGLPEVVPITNLEIDRIFN